TSAGAGPEVRSVTALNTPRAPSRPPTVTGGEDGGPPPPPPRAWANMNSYPPNETGPAQASPPIFALGGLNDTRVTYHEPAKWIARLRATGRGGPFLLKTEMEAGHGGGSGGHDARRAGGPVGGARLSTAGARPPRAPRPAA